MKIPKLKRKYKVILDLIMLYVSYQYISYSIKQVRTEWRLTNTGIIKLLLVITLIALIISEYILVFIEHKKRKIKDHQN